MEQKKDIKELKLAFYMDSTLKDIEQQIQNILTNAKIVENDSAGETVELDIINALKIRKLEQEKDDHINKHYPDLFQER